MISLLILLLPSAVSIVFLFRFLTSRSRHRSRPLLVLLSLAASLFFFADAQYYSSYADYRSLVVWDTIAAYAAPAIPALTMLLLRSLVFRRYMRWYSYVVLFAVLPTLGGMTLTQYLLMGMDGSAQYLQRLSESHPSAHLLLTGMGYEDSVHFVITVTLYYLVTGTLCILTIAQIIYYMRRMRFSPREVTRFLFHGGEIEPVHLEGMLFACMFAVLVARLLLFPHFTHAHRWVMALFSLAIASFTWLIFHVGEYVDRPVLRLAHNGGTPPDAGGGQPLADETRDINDYGDVQVIAEPQAHVDSCASTPPGPEQGMAQLLLDVRAYVQAERPYLSPALSVEDVARAVGSNKTYVSRCINLGVHMTFRDWMNSLRVEHAKEVMLLHPDYVQDEIAAESGFPDAPSFSRKFRQACGVTPRQWLLSQS